jgi:hypothetical protein
VLEAIGKCTGLEDLNLTLPPSDRMRGAVAPDWSACSKLASVILELDAVCMCVCVCVCVCVYHT